MIKLNIYFSFQAVHNVSEKDNSLHVNFFVLKEKFDVAVIYRLYAVILLIRPSRD